jgi:hypothetical protein
MSKVLQNQAARYAKKLEKIAEIMPISLMKWSDFTALAQKLKLPNMLFVPHLPPDLKFTLKKAHEAHHANQPTRGQKILKNYEKIKIPEPINKYSESELNMMASILHVGDIKSAGKIKTI